MNNTWLYSTYLATDRTTRNFLRNERYVSKNTLSKTRYLLPVFVDSSAIHIYEVNERSTDQNATRLAKHSIAFFASSFRHPNYPIGG